MLAAVQAPIDPELMVSDPAESLQKLRRQWQGRCERWIFGYASLIWRPEFDAAEHRPALVHGWHRALRMRSRINRGTPQQPGLVFALLPGGACRGMVYRLRPENGDEELERLWAREMPTGVYDPRLLPCRTREGTVLALAFTLSRRSEAFLPHLPDDEVLHILRHARGRCGSTLDYLAETSAALRERGVRDREIERLVALARRHGLLQPEVRRRVSRSDEVSTSSSTPGSSSSSP
ncbi:Gamma-glutamylcyclotransferase [Rubrivivax sp. A210]|uniref:gamma-glutamylcyclotransferase n=1 Tax=Rubrivivax sp. A210 TaxID=2772301 RepID=UPI0019B6C53C|nr:gamma-glutamylcyclotransferase [Rubrivivax sp. A210]CAD5374613.1 Gamma-glutamylcyclotransferase [Rubrivivax sp. A210]